MPLPGHWPSGKADRPSPRGLRYRPARRGDGGPPFLRCDWRKPEAAKPPGSVRHCFAHLPRLPYLTSDASAPDSSRGVSFPGSQLLLGPNPARIRPRCVPECPEMARSGMKKARREPGPIALDQLSEFQAGTSGQAPPTTRPQALPVCVAKPPKGLRTAPLLVWLSCSTNSDHTAPATLPPY